MLNETYGALDPLDVSFFMATLKYGFGGTGFVFNVSSVDNHIVPLWYRCGKSNNDFEMKFATRKGHADALNIWICDLRDPEILGLSNFPPQYIHQKWNDGVSK